MIRKVITLVLLSCFVFSESSDNVATQENSKLNISDNGSASPKPKGPAYADSRNSYFSYFLVDSSKNGYGGFLERTVLWPIPLMKQMMVMLLDGSLFIGSRQRHVLHLLALKRLAF